ncbi:MAG: LuxR C-terminal-related transcriptional regulator, partial [Bacteroidia bacterium]|nr:LuxR C-terminal-related transcriptional regulator [Bacteroidia bacterium]
ILRHIASEKTNPEISAIMHISPRTVHSHRRNLMQKLGVKNTVGLVRYAIQHGFVNAPTSSNS